MICLSADSAKKIIFLKPKTKTKFSYNLASGFGKNPKWEDMMQELNLVVGPEVGPLTKLTKNGKTVQDPGLIHEKEMFRGIVKYPEVVHGIFIIYINTKKSCQYFTFCTFYLDGLDAKFLIS